jgi:hypothetical protein
VLYPVTPTKIFKQQELCELGVLRGEEHKLALIGFVLPESPNGLIFVILCAKGAYVHSAFSEIGFVLHNHSGHQGIGLPGSDHRSIGLSGRSLLIPCSADSQHPDPLIC